jgi:tRNA A-37 threonylcarbamoyl transferase component Bud32
MNADGVQWSAGDASIQAQVERALAAEFRSATLLHESSRRTVHRIGRRRDPDTDRRIAHQLSSENAGDSRPPVNELVVKIHHLATGRHPYREKWKRLFGQSPARREWKALESLFQAGALVPRPRAWGRLPHGDEIIVTDFINGKRLTDPEADLVDAMASAIAKFHGAGYRHGDLHLGNLLAADREIVLLDLQRARRLRSARDRLWDLARLELSLARAGWNPTLRKALRDRLDVGDEFEKILRRFLRDHLRGRARRVLRVGRNWSTAQVGNLRGLRDVSVEEKSLAALIETCDQQTRKRERRGGRVQIVETKILDPEIGERVVVVKRIASGNLRRALGDRLRGTPAARAFRAGQASELLSERAARPLAFLEERRFGLPVSSLLVLEKVGDEDLDLVSPNSPEAEHRLACALGEWLADGHAWGLSHRDLKASNIRVAIRAEAIRFWMIDLEDLSGPKPLSDEARLHALSQLNASLADEAMTIGSRLAGLQTYESRVPFSAGSESAATLIARRSLARAHRWRGGDGVCRGREPEHVRNGFRND